MKIFHNALRFWRTVRHLHLVQIYARIWFNLYRPKPQLERAPRLRSMLGYWQVPAYRATSFTEPGAFFLLNEHGTLAQNGWDDPSKSKLWRYNQHYFDDLNTRDAVNRDKVHRALICDWISSNLPGNGTGWEPYPISLRVVNWIKWHLAGNQLEPMMQQSLAVQIRWLMRRIERHLMGNHLFANAKALVFAGLFFEGPEADRWLKKGISILYKEIPEQILPDGGQFELSPMYHALAVEDMLDLVNIARTFGWDTQAEMWGNRLPSMLRWLVAMTHPDKNLASFNDTADGIAPRIDDLLSYAVRLGIALPSPLPAVLHLKESGYARLTKGPAVVMADLASIGPDYLPGHAHADTLSFELSLHGSRVIVNSGTSVYGLGSERIRQRGTAAHSTLTIDGKDSSEVWSGFRVGRRAYPLDVQVMRRGDALFAEGAHNGYRYLPGAPIHRRAWKLTSTGLIITDRVESSQVHKINVRFHLAQGYHAEIGPVGVVKIMQENGSVILMLEPNGATPYVKSSTLHPQFGQSLPNQVICLTAAAPSIVETRLDWSI